MIAVSVLVSYALRQNWITTRPKIKRFKTASRVKWLEPADLNPYMTALRQPFRAQMQLLVGTGMRLGETEALRVCDLSFSATSECQASVRDAKTEAGVRSVFVPPWTANAVAAHIQQYNLSGDDLMFTIRHRSVQAEHQRACRLASIHDHRHTAAVALARTGMPLHLLQGQLGHKNIAMTMRYAQFHPDYTDVGPYFDRVAQTFGLAGAGNISGDSRSLAQTPVSADSS